MNLEYVDLKSDTTFKYLFKTKSGRSWISKVILNITGVNLEEYELYDNELNTGNKKKDYRLDLILKNVNKDYTIIEMNNSTEADAIKSKYYAHRLVGKKFNEGEKNVETKTYLINFNNFCNSKMKELTKADFIPTDEKTGLKLEDMRVFEIYLPNYHNMCYDKCNETEKKLWLFGCKSFEEMKSQNLSDEDKWIVEELERLAMDQKFIDEYDAEHVNQMLMNTKYDEGYNSGYDNGIEQGIEQEKIEIAKDMLKENIPVEQISKITKLTLEEIKKLKEEM